MADEPIKVRGIQLNSEPEGDVHPLEAEATGVGLNSKGNFELSNVEVPDAPDDSKVNIVSKTDIQIKPGDDGTLQLDCEKNTDKGNPVELSIKVCNGSYQKSNRVVGAKVNVAEVTIDNQKTHTTQISGEDTYDLDKIKINFRTDKWKTTPLSGPDSPTRRNNVGPVDVKLRAKSFDIRCHGDQPGGGIALQPSGRDSDSHENKIKFESSRTAPLEDPVPTYAPEGGEGLEFGTFNNEHTSLYTKDYRFKGDATVYGVTRGVPEVAPGETKFDYPTQPDDFKDIVDPKVATTWNDIIAAGISRSVVISKSGKQKYKRGNIHNDMLIPIYVDSNNNIVLDVSDVQTVYDAEGNAVQFDADHWTSKAAVYTDAEHTTLVEASSKLFLQDGADPNKYWIADINSSSQLKAYGNSDHDIVTFPVVSDVSTYTKIEPGATLVIDRDPVADAVYNALESATDFADFKTALLSSLNYVPVI